MKDPELFDDENYLEELGKGDEKNFRKLYSKKYRSIDKEFAKDSFISTFEASVEPEYVLFRDIVNAFSDDHIADGSDSGFETTIVNPLYEYGESGAELLLANMNPTGVHLCFVSCNVGGENTNDWREDVNTTKTLLEEENNREKLMSHISCSEDDIRSVQFLTFTRSIDLVDADAEVLRLSTDPDNYAIWKLIESTVPPSDDGDLDGVEEEPEVDKTIKYHSGSVEHPDLSELARDGIDPTLAENDDIRLHLTAHPIFSLGEVCLQIYLNHLSSEEHPKEFNKDEFQSIYREKMHLGDDRDEVEGVVLEKIDTILQTGIECDILKDDDEDAVEEKDYKIMWKSEEAGDIKDMVREKYFDYKAPDEMGELAFERAKKEFEEKEASLTDF